MDTVIKKTTIGDITYQIIADDFNCDGGTQYAIAVVGRRTYYILDGYNTIKVWKTLGGVTKAYDKVVASKK